MPEARQSQPSKIRHKLWRREGYGLIRLLSLIYATKCRRHSAVSAKHKAEQVFDPIGNRPIMSTALAKAKGVRMVRRLHTNLIDLSMLAIGFVYGPEINSYGPRPSYLGICAGYILMGFVTLSIFNSNIS
ncbi:hypothetical protein BDP27DRAFT_987376 [Rhodocollybia butyracea]|uniref:Uncharacterized protein n=1 Tax=Rhodocollybia butyracea TaxID=206335 RepID=A0A9P5U5A6_9AGAR|nr:hypothetical protein BDP27DRAFT_987376 [Rhodocollybia butyracea]